MRRELLLLALAVSLFALGNCESNPSVVVGDKTYVLHSQPLSWRASSNVCKEDGGHLISLTSAAVETVLVDLFAESDATCSLSWIGFNDIASENNWVWESGESSTYTHWMSGEPNNMEREFEVGDQSEPLCMLGYTEDMDTIYDWEGTGEDCAFVGWTCLFTNSNEGSTLEWFDLNCGVPLPFVCEIPVGARKRSLEVDDECPATWKFHNASGKCFKQLSDSVSVAECVENCACKKATLACPQDSATNEFINQHVKKTPNSLGWLGISDYFKKGSYQCIKESTPDKITFDNWKSPLENHVYDPEKKYENCAVIDKDGTWTSEPCHMFESWEDEGPECICEKGATKTIFTGLLSKELKDLWVEDWNYWYDEDWSDWEEWGDWYHEDDDYWTKEKDDDDDDDDDEPSIPVLVIFAIVLLTPLILCCCFLFWYCNRRFNVKVEIARIQQAPPVPRPSMVEMQQFPQQPLTGALSTQGRSAILGGGRPNNARSVPSTAGAASAATSTNQGYAPLRDDIPYAKAEWQG
mmetsp:Transcript_9919/g.20193  ORF Transcript_9919/g.20193 Transcript_9919/m.20193 type:complete len:523 (+) Transcript_9919:149-1717(+)|eukprot:CAMPEP_0118655882 /NCGR_PEP_ID=MMETSP0785-20121206/13185_1 /TAXON_ID=91992 /ORGANISM="Bolidomonas pacifica, Strain CCMP 1866" /LENGTH=522 /DNA_ID=CAMNT_0006548689 /DNA_START=115 /DNA_END=1683 /DNA_ORIENTATION=-